MMLPDGSSKKRMLIVRRDYLPGTNYAKASAAPDLKQVIN
jgi:hypothetical protein